MLLETAPQNATKLDINEDIFEHMERFSFNELHFKYDAKTGLKAIIAIHSIKLGPALGGCRFIEYPSTDAAVTDVMRLARGMSYKAAISGLNLGGGKAVILKPPKIHDRKAFFHAFGEFVEELNGKYITAKDSGTSLEDMDSIGERTAYIASLSTMEGLNGNPSPFTAQGVLKGIEAAVKYKYGKTDLSGMRVALQGVGDVGYSLAKALHERGALLTVCDIDEKAVKTAVEALNAKAVSTEDIYDVDCDIFSPCALGATINDQTIPRIKAGIIAGCANNQLARSVHGEVLRKKDVLYAPDYVVNAGGLVFAGNQYLGIPLEETRHQVDNIYSILYEIFTRSEKEMLPTNRVADTIAEERLV